MAITMLSPNVGYIEGSFTTVGVIFSKSGAIIVDSGWGKKDGRKILSELQSIDKKLVAIVNTHNHLDHAGSNSYLQQETGCEIYCTLYESLLVLGVKTLFPALFTGSVYPINDGIDVYNNLEATNPVVIEAETILEIDGITLEIIDLAGHSHGQIGIVYENILFCGDAILEPAKIKETKILFVANPPMQRKTLERLKESSYSMYVGAHGLPFSNPRESCELVEEMLKRVERHVFEITSEPKGLDDIVCYVANKFNLHLKQIAPFNVARNTIQSMLNACIEKGEIEYLLIDNRFVYKKK